MFDTIEAWTRGLAEVDLPASDAAVVDELRALEELKCAAEARQARLAAALPESPGTAHQVALARRESPHRGRRHLGLARVLTREMPHTMAAFREGRITEWRASILARETACLTLAERREVDRLLAADPERLEAMGDREIEHAARRLAYRLDPASFVTRRRQAEADRCVTIRPAPDSMACVTGLLPMAQGVAVWATLGRQADSARAAGDPRSRGQLMADGLVAAILAAAPARGSVGPQAPQPPGVPVSITLLVSDRVLFGTAEDAAHVDGYGPVPAELARELATDPTALRTFRRVYACPESGQLVAMDARSRIFPDSLARFIRLRDRVCRTPWCDAPIRHSDHVRPDAWGGPTSVGNGQGLCEACNLAKEAPGWRSRSDDGVVHTRTATGHRYRSRAPDVRPPPVSTRFEIAVRDLVLAG